ncbi:MAG: NADH-quinone oxidoreductase subunit N [Chloroflexota bacterium]
MFEAPTLQTLADFNLNIALPAIWLASSVMILLLVDLFLPDERKDWTPILALTSISIAFVMTLLNFSPDETEAFGGMFAADGFTGFLNIATLGTAFFAVLLSTDYLKKANIYHGEYYTLLLLSAAGVMFMVSANNLLVIFVALEVLSIPLYILSAFRATDAEHISQSSGLVSRGDIDPQILKSQESGIKYFILGAFSSAFLVYGMALIYGATGSFMLPEIAESISEIVIGSNTQSFLLLAGVALTVVGLGFKVAAVPFHMWTPDVYEGAPTPVTAYMSVAAKIGGFAALFRLMITGLAGFSLGETDIAAWVLTMQFIAGATLILGNVMALAQTNIKRMLAYSSIAHAGYILMAVAAVGVQSAEGISTAAAQGAAIYLLAYMFTNIGAFAIVQAVENQSDDTGSDISDFDGLFNSRPVMAVGMAIFMFSLTGIPLTGGFFGKWLVFSAAVQADLILLAVVGVLTSVISAFYYMRVVVAMFLNDGDGSETPGATVPVTMAIYAAMAGTLITGIVVPVIASMASQIQF